ncbi:peptidoglycan-binding protein [Roseimicrobium sp. ORNL1]|uniref:peptidoglycan-binding protein n=1 Tax=Roseimicrobium sp. ORNL1 TaxID=2711231 RepID=UPI00197E57FF|nr:peptidoglycan-binding protein [Roseimicrobium sp. ORNL1]
MKILPRPFTALLAATIALALTGGDLMAAKKDKDKGGGNDRKGKKEQVQRRSGGGGGGDRSPRVAHSKPAAPKPEHRVAARSAQKPKADKPSSRDRKHDTTRLAVQRSSKGRDDNARKRSEDIARHQLASSSAASRARAADANRKSIERSQNVAKARERGNNDRDRARVAAASRDVNRNRADVRRDVSRDRADVRREIDRRNIGTVASSAVNRDRDRDGDRRTRSHRDRSHYTERHDHDHNHNYDWYRSNGYYYDHDYYRTYHRHRYYNDSLGVFLFSLTAPPAYVYESTPYAYDSTPNYYSGYGYQTRVAVQEELARAGYYDGTLDGVIGPGTRSAIYAYQQDYGLYASGQIDDQLLQSLGLTSY